MKIEGRILSLLGLGFAVALAFVRAAGQTGNAQEMPGPLSAFHAAKPGPTDCSACHSAPGKVAPAKCLTCHTEIASRIAARTGFHRDKAEDCAVCHAEHHGAQANIVPLDPSDFDHSETGADLRGAHLRPKTCDTCHTPANGYPRSKGRSYLLKVPGCRGCHHSPHAGGQDQCLACHDQNSWIVGRRGIGD
jgi:hypothetical protein